MSKSTKIIAGAGVAALAIAAVPAIASYAADFEDIETSTKYSVTVDPVWSFDNEKENVTATDKLVAGGEIVTIGTHTLTVHSNNSKGYHITAQNTAAKNALTSGAEKDDIALGTAKKGDSAWTLAIAATDANGATIENANFTPAVSSDSTAATIVNQTTLNAKATQAKTVSGATGDVYTVTATASAAANQAVGTYTSTVKYTLVANS